MPYPPKWVRECALDITDVIGRTAFHALPLIGSGIWLLRATFEPTYYFIVYASVYA